MRTTPCRLGACAAALVLALSACTGDAGGGDASPEEALSAAKTTLDETSGVRISLATEELPPGVDGVIRAEGVGTHDPAFEGDMKVRTGGVEFDVPVVAAQGKVFARLPFTTEFVQVQPGDYGAPDPASLMEPEGGLSSLLAAATEVEEGEQTRSGEEVLTGYTAVVPGDAVASIIPSASPGTDFAATFRLDDRDRLRVAVLSGPFYRGTDELTYTITFDEYDTSADIALP